MKIRSQWMAWVIAAAAVTTARLLFWTCRKKFIAADSRYLMNRTALGIGSDHIVLCVWHDSLLIPTFTPSRALRETSCCLVSQHQDGSYLANGMAMLGYTTVRGSSRRGGAEALRQLLTDTAGKHIVFTPDGPGGPRRIVKQGCVYVASQLGRCLLPGAFVATRAWRPKGSWTDLVIPKPFSTVYVITGEPISIPPDLSREQLRHYIDVAQQAMDRLNEDAERIVSGKLPTPPQSTTRAAA